MRRDPLDVLVRSPSTSGVLLDVDGTLSPIAELPETAALEAGAEEVLAELVTAMRVVAVISGRRHEELARLIPVPGVRFVAMYGLAGEPPVPSSVVAEVEATAAGLDGVWVERKGATVAVHFRQAPDPVATAAVLQDRLARIGAASGMELIAGKRVRELIPAGHPLKEGAVERIVREHALSAVLYAGDDRADLLAFRALDRLVASDGLVAVKVAVRGSGTPDELVSDADVTLNGPTGLVRFLRRLVTGQGEGGRT
jgi:trehalose 6-phosphate phosphatase